MTGTTQATARRQLLSIKGFADYAGVSANTVYQWRSKGYGPVSVRIGRHVRYDIDDIHAWLDGLKDTN